MKVRTGHGYPIPFLVALGQRNAIITEGYLAPLRHLVPHASAFTLFPPGYDLMHSINAVPVFTRRPYVITFEDLLPRLPPGSRSMFLSNLLLNHLTKPQCVGLLAMSEFAVRQMRWQNRGSPYLPALLAKTRVMYPVAPCVHATIKELGRPLRLIFVGSDFMRKGLPVVVRAHERLRQLGIAIETTVVSSLRWSKRDYLGPPDRRLVEAERERLRRSGITVMGGLPNAQVLPLIRNSHFKVLPTFHDTFGFSMIEALASGTPLIATDTCAQPEIVSPDNGYLLPFSNDSTVGMWEWSYRKREYGYTEAYFAEVERVASNLVEQVRAVVDGPASTYRHLSQGALAFAHDRFNRKALRDELERVYDDALLVPA